MNKISKLMLGVMLSTMVGNVGAMEWNDLKFIFGDNMTPQTTQYMAELQQHQREEEQRQQEMERAEQRHEQIMGWLLVEQKRIDDELARDPILGPIFQLFDEMKCYEDRQQELDQVRQELEPVERMFD